MFNIEEYLTSGIIESHFLGTTTPEETEILLQRCKKHLEVKAYFDQTQQAFDYYLKSMEVDIPEDRKTVLWKEILEEARLAKITLSEEGVLSDFIDISKSENFSKLNELIQNLHSPAEYDNIHLINIYAKAGRELNLVWVKDRVPMEEHPHLDESFLVLEGTADCYIDGVVTKMKRGDFMRIPPESHHEVIITSSIPAKAIQCRISL
ncbi:MAG: cupin domain-containing protein [Saprospiraceae bacterium]